jgi:aerobic carbon-monoxide dehydrogenase small subunit
MNTLDVVVNDRPYTVDVEDRTLLIDLLRDHLGLTGTHNGCMEARCGCCAVLVDGRAVKSCNVLALQVANTRITTVEGLADQSGHLSPLQQAFREHGAVQCGFCTPGMLTVLTDVIADNPTADADQLRDGIRGNLCRCTGYQKIIDAALSVTSGEHP